MKFVNEILEGIWKDRYSKNGESLDDNFRRVAKYIASNKEEEEEFYKVISNTLFLPAGRTMSNSGIGRDLTLNNCFVAPQIKDELVDIFSKVSLGARTHQKGGGIGYDFSQLRPNGTPTSNDAIASGAISFMDVFNAQTSTILQGGRRGANMGVMNVYNMDILEFITAKSYDEGKLNHFNVSVMVDDEFMDAVKNNKTIFLHHPVYSENGKIEKNPDNWEYKKEVNARDIWEEIMKRAYDNGEPGIFFYDNLNNDNNLWYIENIVCSNPCAEYLAGTIYGEDKDGNKLNSSDFGGACNLGSLFLHNFVDSPFTKDACVDYNKLKSTIFTATRMLDNIIDINNFPDEIYRNYQKSFRTIGLGITGFADMLAMLGMKYNSKEAVDFASKLMNFISLNTYKASIALAKEKGEFPLLDRQKFVESGFIQKHCKNDENNDMAEEWLSVMEDILKYGIRNSKMISIAPTGTLSLTFGNNCSSGLEPIFSLEYERKVKMGGQSEENIKIVPMRDYAYGRWLEVKNGEDCNAKEDVFITALEMTVDEHVDMLAALAYHVDMSCSKTINVPSEYSFEDTKKIYKKCHELGIKGCTIFRPNEIRKGILISEKDENKQSVDETISHGCDSNCGSCMCSAELPRGHVVDVSEDLVGYKRKLMTGCGSLHFEMYCDEETGLPQETFLNVGSGGGCERNYQFISRLMSLALRAGVSLDDIIDQATSIRPCTSYVNRTKTKNDTSVGTSCPSAIGNALKDLKKKMPNIFPIENMNQKNMPTSSNPANNIVKQEMMSNKPINSAKCPDCGEELSFEGGCNVCKYCGWSKCN